MFNNITSLLYIEDDDITRENITDYLKRHVKTVLTANDGKEGLKLYFQHKPQVIITDIEMPFISGLELARKIRQDNEESQIIITTAYTEKRYLLEAVNLQLVQYLLKPIELNKLYESIKKCNKQLQSSQPIKFNFSKNAFYDMYSRELLINNELIALTVKERELLELLIKNSPSPISFENIVAKVYNDNCTKEAVRSTIKTLRKKMPEHSIVNIYGLGYKVELLEQEL